jgi:hypothetical protein
MVCDKHPTPLSHWSCCWNSFTDYWVSHNCVPRLLYLAEHFTWKSFFTFPNLLCSVVNEQFVQEYCTVGTSASILKKAIHPLPTHWATPFTLLEAGVLLPQVDRGDDSSWHSLQNE